MASPFSFSASEDIENMFPADEPIDQPEIIWSEERGRFIDAQTGRFVSNIVGVQTLRLGRLGGQPAYFDQAGRVVPDPANLTFGTTTFEYGNIVRTWRPARFDPYERNAPKSGYYVTMASYIDDAGNVKFVTVFNRVGTAINFDDEQRRIAAAIAKQENIPLGARGSKVITAQATRLFHWVAQ